MRANFEAIKFDQMSEQMGSIDSIQEYGEVENIKMGRAIVIVENDRCDRWEWSTGARTLIDHQCKNSSNLVTTQIMIVMTMWACGNEDPGGCRS